MGERTPSIRRAPTSRRKWPSVPGTILAFVLGRLPYTPVRYCIRHVGIVESRTPVYFFVPVARCGATSLRVARRGSAAVPRPATRPMAQQYSIAGRKFCPLLYRCVLFSLFFTLVSRCFERQDHGFEVVSLFANLHSSTCPVSSKAGFYSGERDRVDQQETLVLSVKDRA